MATLANQTISSTYDGLIKTSTDQPVPISGVQLLEDGVGNSLALSVGRANQGVTVTGTLTATSITGVLADGVTATTQTLGDNSTKVATTAYVDAQVTASDLDFAGDSGTGAVDLDSQTFTIAGTANEIETSASGQTITVGLPNNVTIAGNLTVDTNTLYVDATNNRVGIGTSSPTTKAHIQNAALTGFQTRAAATLTLENSTDTELYIASGDANSGQLRFGDTGSTFRGAISYDHSSDAFLHYTAGSERMRIDSSGNVGIGTSSPASNLHISTAFPEIRLQDNAYPATNHYSTIDGNGGSGILSLYADKGNTAANSSIDFYVDNSLTMRVDNGGNIGIGTSSPSSYSGYTTLTLNNNTNGGVLTFSNNSSPVGLIYNSPNDFVVGAEKTGANLIFRTNSTGTPSERMRIDSSGNVGIGTSSPTASLEIHDSVEAVITLRDTSAFSAGTGPYINFQGNDNTGTIKTFSQIYGVSNTANDGEFLIKTRSGGALTERMRIDSSGNVGIGITPATTLDVAATTPSLRITNTKTTLLQETVGSLEFFTKDSSSGASRILSSIVCTTETASSNPEGILIFKTVVGGAGGAGVNAIERMRITSSGFLKASDNGSYLGAGNNYHEFNNSTTEWTQVNTNTNSVGQGLLLRLNSSTASTLFLAGYSTNISAYRFKIYADGDIENANNSYGVLSDIKLKENIVDATPKLDDLMQVKIRNYNLIGEDLKQIGVVAQELEEVFPAIVYERADTEEVEVTDEEGNVTTKTVETGETTKSVKMSVFVPILIKAMQEQQEIINDLKTRIETLETK